MTGWPCASDTWPSCGTGCVQPPDCIACFQKAGTWSNDKLAFFAADCPDRCYPEGLISARAVAALEWHAAQPARRPFFLAVGFKRPHLSYKVPIPYLDFYPELDDIPLPTHKTFPATGDGAGGTLPPISYKSNCQSNFEDTKPYGVNESCTASLCTEVISNDTTTRKLRQMYYASISLTDAHLGVVLDALEATGLASNTIITLIGDHGYDTGQKDLWCKCNTFETGTRIPMFVAPPQGDAAWARNATSDAIVESVDLFPTIASLAGLDLPRGQSLGGESLVPFLLRKQDGAAPPRQARPWALSQWPRRPSCVHHLGCIDGHGDPSQPGRHGDIAVMGYTLRVDQWRYGAWFNFSYAEDEAGRVSGPDWDAVLARELYNHAGDDGGRDAYETFETVDLASDPAHAATVEKLHAQLIAAVKTGLVPPMQQRDEPPPPVAARAATPPDVMRAAITHFVKYSSPAAWNLSLAVTPFADNLSWAFPTPGSAAGVSGGDDRNSFLAHMTGGYRGTLAWSTSILGMWSVGNTLVVSAWDNYMMKRGLLCNWPNVFWKAHFDSNGKIDTWLDQIPSDANVCAGQDNATALEAAVRARWSALASTRDAAAFVAAYAPGATARVLVGAAGAPPTTDLRRDNCTSSCVAAWVQGALLAGTTGPLSAVVGAFGANGDQVAYSVDVMGFPADAGDARGAVILRGAVFAVVEAAANDKGGLRIVSEELILESYPQRGGGDDHQ